MYLEAFLTNSEAKNNFEKLSYTGKREYVLWINDAKKVEMRQNRIEKSLHLLTESKNLDKNLDVMHDKNLNINDDK